MKIGLVGLPKSGKTSLFNLLTGASVATSSYGGSRAEMHAGIARVPDERVDRLSALFKPKKTTFASFEVVERRLERLEASIKKKRIDAEVKEQAILLRLKPALESETPIRAADLSDDDARAIRGFTFLSQ